MPLLPPSTARDQKLTFGGDPASSVQRQKMGFSEKPVPNTHNSWFADFDPIAEDLDSLIKFRPGPQPHHFTRRTEHTEENESLAKGHM